VLAAEVRSLPHRSSILGRDKKRTLVLLPERRASDRLPVCYYLHGWGGTSEAFLNHPGIRAVLASAPQISVFPESFRNWFINDHEGNRYEDYFVEELLPHVERTLAADIDDRRRLIGGFSMGGLSALSLAWRHPGLFQGVACFAGAFEAPRRTGDPYAGFRNDPELLIPSESEHTRVWGPADSEVRRRHDPYLALAGRGLPGTRLYLCIGTRDYKRMLEMNGRFREFLQSIGVPHRYDELDGGHDMDLVAAALPASLQHLYGPEAP
jgi:S-formylglutathione hydrolase FrmB